MRQNTLRVSGFTLIELIIVIVILGILSVVAAPRFIDISSDARASAIESLTASVKSFDKLVYSKSLILGIQNNNHNSNEADQDLQGGFFLGNDFIHTAFGHPWLFNESTIRNVINADVEFQSGNSKFTVCEYDGEFCAIKFSSGGLNGVAAYTGSAIAFYFSGDNVNANCFAYYIFDTDVNDVRIGNNISGC